jgi:hypothetical protein
MKRHHTWNAERRGFGEVLWDIFKALMLVIIFSLLSGWAGIKVIDRWIADDDLRIKRDLPAVQKQKEQEHLNEEGQSVWVSID